MSVSDLNKGSVTPDNAVRSNGGPYPEPPNVSNEAQSVNDDENHTCMEHLSKAAASGSKKIPDPEKVAKELAKLEKKAAKAEKEKRTKEAHDKSRSLMANFFAKPKASAAPALQTAHGPSDFEKTFRPFLLKKDTVRAPINWFTALGTKRQAGGNMNAKEIIVITDTDEFVVDVDDTTNLESASDTDVSMMSSQERLKSILSSLPEPMHQSLRPPRNGQFKTASPITVRALVSDLTEAEIVGSTSRVRRLMAKLASREAIPAKVLIFHDDLRPGYFGTWTRSSRVIGARTPFAKDVVALDYGYDSGLEWDEEDANGDNVDEDGEDEDGDGEGDGPDSDLDSWLVDDDETEEIAGGQREISPSALLDIPLPPKRKQKEPENPRKLEKKRKVVSPLVSFAKGPCWEEGIGRCSYDAFKPYKIHLFNDTHYPINPFTFVSSVTDKPSTSHPNANQGDFKVPPLPQGISVPGVNFESQPSVFPAMPKVPRLPKTSFPEAHLPALLSKITSLATGSFNFLVESIYQDLREHQVKKNAIVAKLKEVGEKCKEKKIWVIKDDVVVTQGLLNAISIG